MSAKTDIQALRLIGAKIVRLLSLPDEQLDAEAEEGLRLIADIARWRELLAAPVPRFIAIDEGGSGAPDFEVEHRLDAVAVILKPLVGLVFGLTSSG